MIKYKNGSQIRYLVFVIFFYIIIFRELFAGFIPVFNYLDEGIACLAIPIAGINILEKKGKIHIRTQFYKNTSMIWLFLCLTFALIGNVVFKYQKFDKAVLPDLLLNLKFWLGIYVGNYFFKKFDLNVYSSKIAKHIKRVVCVYIVLIIADNIIGIYPGDIRYGIKSTQLFYGIHTLFCAMCVILLGLFVAVKKYTNHFNFFSLLLLFLIASTMRSKAFGAVALFVLLYYLIYLFNKKINAKAILGIGCLSLIVGWSQIQFYFFSNISDGAARNVLLRTSFKVAKEHFPLGAGLGTFASFYSGVEYSRLYYKYGISNIYGLTKNNPAYMTDSFWPMEIAQNGFVGTVCFVIALYILFRKFQEINKLNKDIYFAGLFLLGYLCISSIAETAFVNSACVWFGLVIGLFISRIENNRNNVYEEIENADKVDVSTVS